MRIKQVVYLIVHQTNSYIKNTIVLFARPGQKVLLGFSNRNFSVATSESTITSISRLPCAWISLRSCRIALLSNYKSKGTESAPVPAYTPAYTLVHNNLSRADGWSPLRLVAVAEIGQKDYYYYKRGLISINKSKLCDRHCVFHY